MAEENLVVEEEVYVNEQCCPECLSPGECGNILEELSEAKGEDLYDSCGCECEVATKRWNIRAEVHADPNIDTSAAEVPDESVE